jgi:hypothetical protein
MSVVVFVGPTLSAAEVTAELDAVCLPPVSQGDLQRVALTRPRAIGVIDGYFERVPAVWHKEILWAIAQGIPVFGSGSMGALRAAELAPFGMIGVGEIFAAFRDGRLEDDDEVAVAHAAGDHGYRAMSEPMVNIRATLRAAEEARVVTPSTRMALEDIAKALFYPERDYPEVIQRGAAAGLPPAELAALTAWLPTGRIDQKRADAIAMLRAMREHLAADQSAAEPSFAFEHTVFFDRLLNSAGETTLAAGDGAGMLSGEVLLDELLLDGDLYVHALYGAMARHLALAEARRQDLAIDDDALAEAVADFRRFHGLADGAFDEWLAANQLNLERFRALMADEALVRRLLIYRIGWEVRRRLPDQLRVTGEYGRLAARARHKQHLLAAFEMDNPSLDDAGLTLDELIAWHDEYTNQLPGQSTQGRVALMRFARDNPAAFSRALLREFCYLALQDEHAPQQAAP